jgi:hypothetical protein
LLVRLPFAICVVPLLGFQVFTVTLAALEVLNPPSAENVQNP